MKQEIAYYLRGQVEAVRMLTGEVIETVHTHCDAAAKELVEITYACNRAIAVILEAAEGKKDRGKENP